MTGDYSTEEEETRFFRGLQDWNIVFFAIFVKNHVRIFIKRHLRTLDIS